MDIWICEEREETTKFVWSINRPLRKPMLGHKMTIRTLSSPLTSHGDITAVDLKTIDTKSIQGPTNG